MKTPEYKTINVYRRTWISDDEGLWHLRKEMVKSVVVESSQVERERMILSNSFASTLDVGYTFEVIDGGNVD